MELFRTSTKFGETEHKLGLTGPCALGRIMDLPDAITIAEVTVTSLWYNRTVANLAAAQKRAASTGKYGREVELSALAFIPVSEDSGGPLPPSHLYQRDFPSLSIPKADWSDEGATPLSPPSVHSSSIRYLIPIREVGNALVTPLRLRVSMGGNDHLLSNRSLARSARGYAIKNSFMIPNN
ncbi:hypothetical protein EVAR_3530_1 [Eumeta japonica]|uniref:Uncharacterized protein n=1 Tax=Eumeta variegata TaxID=151549 RepID=A0A4C1SY12_EUMVA|nr:hypothetical protein EVAR_3530_1 [Eumeta japonica]